jgi:hypothetical protein
MQTHRTILVCLVIFVVGLTPSAFGQLSNHFPLSHRELGYYDRDTGVFTPLHSAAQDAEIALATTPTTGDFVFNITITLKTAVPKNGVVACDAHVFVNGDSSGFNAQESGFALATGTGTTRTCKISLPYSWLLASPTTDSVSLSYNAFIGDGIEITATNGTGTAIQFADVHTSDQFIAPIKVPANGANTTENISVTL